MSLIKRFLICLALVSIAHAELTVDTLTVKMCTPKGCRCMLFSGANAQIDTSHVTNFSAMFDSSCTLKVPRIRSNTLYMEFVIQDTFELASVKYVSLPTLLTINANGDTVSVTSARYLKAPHEMYIEYNLTNVSTNNFTYIIKSTIVNNVDIQKSLPAKINSLSGIKINSSIARIQNQAAEG